MVDTFLRALDARWAPCGAEPVPLHVLGSTALFLQSDYRRGTKDSDVLEAEDLPVPVRDQLLRLGGRGGELHRQHGVYLDIVARTVPFLPEEPAWNTPPGLEPAFSNFAVDVLDVVDVVVTKIWRNHATDREDIEAMVRRGLVPHARLLARFRSAVSRFWLDARAEDLPRAVAALHRVERDMLGVAETPVDLPAWVDD